MSLYFRNNKCSIKSAMNNSTYELNSNDFIYIAYPGQTVTLPDPTNCIGQTYIVKLGAIRHSTNDNVTINVLNNGIIEGNQNHILNVSYGYHKFVAGLDSFNNYTWLIIT